MSTLLKEYLDKTVTQRVTECYLTTGDELHYTFEDGSRYAMKAAYSEEFIVSKLENKSESGIITQLIKVVHESDEAKFEKEVHSLIAQGYRIDSTSCGFVQSERYDFCNAFHAVLIKG
jgi:hypothetical protein